ncbi:tRNA (adenine(22)-N(1))-methyltransferase TrmK [Vagococcus entomophilus]|uniref:SAM-dependent methyltransferase n=1 Tax=Vagococcus entomophilus TaxID=1160095 RepID=A0A430AJ67_9ENTE|nr:tRNA (adenine(22)-N(1))-methyltransferase TrmK [Vagococcus entomophilus]RSU08034.1 SAM-dependent methyltransferase [Vagococcus entomophilus]
MNEQKLSQRLQAVANYVPSKARLADIGSDHAYLPAWLVLNQKISYAVAGEVVQGPFLSAKKLVESCNLQAQIVVRLADGLQAISDQDAINVVTICGMGGFLIREILENGVQKGKLQGTERLILQPNIGEYSLRKWLMQHNYRIIAEEILEEDAKIYGIIVAEKDQRVVHYTEKELIFGPILMQEKSVVFKKKWQHEKVQKGKILKNLKKAQVSAENLAKLKEITDILERIDEVI